MYKSAKMYRSIQSIFNYMQNKDQKKKYINQYRIDRRIKEQKRLSELKELLPKDPNINRKLNKFEVLCHTYTYISVLQECYKEINYLSS